MFFCTHIEDQSLRGPLLKALKLVCMNQGGWGAPHLTDIKRMGGWEGHSSHFHQLKLIFIQHLCIDDNRLLIKAKLGPPFSLKNVWERFKFVVKCERLFLISHFMAPV